MIRTCLDVAVYRRLRDTERAAHLVRVLPVSPALAGWLVAQSYVGSDGRLDRVHPGAEAVGPQIRQSGGAVWRPPIVARVVLASAKLCDASVGEVDSRRRFKPASRARAVACAALRRLKFSTPLAGRYMQMDHSSVIVAARKAEARWSGEVDAAVAAAKGGPF